MKLIAATVLGAMFGIPLLANIALYLIIDSRAFLIALLAQGWLFAAGAMYGYGTGVNK